jgi:hypothetical protein
MPAPDWLCAGVHTADNAITVAITKIEASILEAHPAMIQRNSIGAMSSAQVIAIASSNVLRR